MSGSTNELWSGDLAIWPGGETAPPVERNKEFCWMKPVKAVNFSSHEGQKRMVFCARWFSMGFLFWVLHIGIVDIIGSTLKMPKASCVFFGKFTCAYGRSHAWKSTHVASLKVEKQHSWTIDLQNPIVLINAFVWNICHCSEYTTLKVKRIGTLMSQW